MSNYFLSKTDSSALLKRETRNRDLIFHMYKKDAKYANTTMAQFEFQFRTTTSVFALMEAYDLSKAYENLESVSDLIDNDTYDATLFAQKSRFAYQFTQLTRAFCPLPAYTNLLSSVNRTFKLSTTLHITPDVIHDLISMILKALLKYADELSQLCEYLYPRYKSRGLDKHALAPFWNVSDTQFSDMSDSHMSPFKHEWDTFVYNVMTTDVPVELIKFVLSPTLGSAGISHVFETKSPIAVNVIVYEQWMFLINKPVSTIFSGNGITGSVSDFQNIVDPDLQALEGLATKSLRSSDFQAHKESLINRANTKLANINNDDDDPDAPKGEEGATVDDDKGKDPNDPNFVPPPPTGPPPPQPPPPPPQPTIPDDSSYTPNSSLAWKERDFISMIQSLPTMDMSRDHMTRFNTTNESPHALSLQDVMKNDKTTFAGQNRFSQRYLITFTRMSRKPIFNPVS